MAAEKTRERIILAQKYITIHGRGSVLSSGERKMVLTVFGNLLSESTSSLREVAERTAVLTGTSRATVERIRKEADEGKIVTPGKKRPRAKGTKTRMKKTSDFTKIGIRRIVHDMFRRNRPPTLAAITEKVNEDDSLPAMSKATVHRHITDLGFVYERRSRRSMFIERDDLIIWRRKYLRDIRKYRRENKPIYYLDETFLNAGHTVKHAWRPSYIKSARHAALEGETTGLKNIPGRGGRLIVVHIGNENGFLKEASEELVQNDVRLIFQGKKNKRRLGGVDYHEEMNSACFENWFENKVLPNLPPSSVIVMDNASYHSRTLEKFPNMSWRKDDIQQYLTTKEVEWTTTLVKAELLQLAEPFRSASKKYVVDEMAAEAGHTVLRLPPYHCDLNPIELAWANVKNNVALHNVSYKLQDVEEMLNNNISNLLPETWRSFVEHIKKVEDSLWELDNVVDEITDENRIVVNIGNSSDSDTDSNSELEEDDILAEELPAE
ncbi:uncharacterized protein LOC129000372 [Macrosteles quadrilineatus]|uniref:uncharacterized protein LOC128981880 n=1 Tax=Macrosteles quadrilineatus TaxID=74068 RepID=UPI0023E20C6B|nr:uncharacterized protein LOC128981880 [Macrosteles quadrilineatus]XP_054283310.1 uncharacterized protein LOC129000372 [Macrosteles quadrilineatus]